MERKRYKVSDAAAENSSNPAEVSCCGLASIFCPRYKISPFYRAALSRLKRVSFQEWSRYVKRKQWQRTEEEANKLMQSVANLTEERDKMSKDVRGFISILHCFTEAVANLN